MQLIIAPKKTYVNRFLGIHDKRRQLAADSGKKRHNPATRVLVMVRGVLDAYDGSLPPGSKSRKLRAAYTSSPFFPILEEK
jgi:hypothetical protein